MNEPRTKAGKALLAWLHGEACHCHADTVSSDRDAILAIEAEAATGEGLDAGRLARAIMLYEDRQRVYPRTSDTPSTIDHFMAQGIAAEYARLAADTATEGES